VKSCITVIRARREIVYSEIVTRTLHESVEGTLSQRTIKGLLDVPVVTSVLVGMRRPE